MRTAFSEDQLTDPHLRAAEATLRRCVHCGFCTATCPTYVLLGDERDSPRGRIALIQNMLESGEPPSPETVRHIDRCLSCLGCRTTCPSGVDYGVLVDTARGHINEHYRRPFRERLFRAFVLRVLMHPALFKTMMFLGRAFSSLAGRLPGRLGTMARKVPKSHTLDAQHRKSPEVPAGSKRVALFPGCAQRSLSPEIDYAARRVLARRKIDAVRLSESGCCGALALHMGETSLSKKYARRLIAEFEKAVSEGNFAAATMTATGCTAFLKDYGTLFAGDPVWETRARAFAAKISDFVELAEPCAQPAHEIAMKDWSVAYHPPCSLQHAQGIQGRGEALLTSAGFKLLSFSESHLCCGSAGSYSLLQPDISDALKARKLSAIKESGAKLIASANAGCIKQLSAPGAPPAIHIAELIDWADGGPKPVAIKDD